jgi:cyclophilin family peptidyl-prolyl cis-trans isomerase
MVGRHSPVLYVATFPILACPASCEVLLCPGKYTIMGQVIDGMEVLDKLEKLPVGKHIVESAPVLATSHPDMSACALCTQMPNAGAQDRPTHETRISRVTIHANPMAS